MKYFFDTEFIEHATGIELLSIGIVAENGKSFYAENTAVDHRLADDWVKENVISKLIWTKVGFDNINGSKLLIADDNSCGGYEKIKQDILSFIGEDKDPEFYAYFADYDWVVFCKIFGRMIDLPSKFPMYCKDLKQTLDEKVMSKCSESDWYDIITIKNHPDYPKQLNEHNALDDAMWNKKLYEFLKTI